MDVTDKVRVVLKSVLQIENDMQFDSNMLLIGAIPGFDSMSVISIIAALEDMFGFTVEDDEINAEVFETFGSLLAFVERKL